METTLLTRVGPETRTWIKREADRSVAAGTISEATAVRTATSYPYTRLANADVEAMAFLIMMESSRSAREDLREIAASVKAINDAKASFVQASNSAVRSKEDLACLDHLSEMESLRLQMAMDRLSKMMSTLSNILKKISDTANSITQNLK